MYKPQFTNILGDQLMNAYQPAMALNRTVLDGLEKLTNYQLESIRFYTDFGLNQVQQLANLEGNSDLKAYTRQQTESLSQLGKQLTSDIHRFHLINNEIKSSVMQCLHSSSPHAPKPK